MRKPASCRAALEAALPYLVAEPDRLIMFIDDGQIAAGLVGPSFEYKYTLTIGLIDFNQHPDTVMVPLLHWLRENEPALLQNPDRRGEAISFTGEIKNHDSYDLRATPPLLRTCQSLISTNRGRPLTGCRSS